MSLDWNIFKNCFVWPVALPLSARWFYTEKIYLKQRFLKAVRLHLNLLKSNLASQTYNTYTSTRNDYKSY